MINIVSWVIVSALVIILMIDIVFISADWLGRIHIGRYDNKQRWNEAITRRGLEWLRSTPRIKKTDNTRLVILDMIKGNYSSSTIQHWQEAALLLGLSEYVKVNNNESLKEQVLAYLNRKFDREGQWVNKPVHVDGAILAYALMKLDIIETDNYKRALDSTWDLIKEHIGADGTVLYRKNMQKYRYVDTIGFICPFLIAYGLKYNKDECITLAVQQIKAYEQYGMHEQLYIPCHAYQVDSKAPLGLYGWGRGLGWFAIGLIDAWNELPEQHPYKSQLSATIQRLASAMIPLQQPNGSWSWTVTRPESRPDSSTTATLGWFLLNASKIAAISVDSLRASDLAIQYLMKVTRRSGAVDFSQGDTKDIGVYSMLFNILPFTQGFCIRIMNSKLKIR